VHWSWWIFGGVVVGATAIAGCVVLVLHVNAYDVRHESYVLGTVNSGDVTVTSFYGVYAPVSGPVDISQPKPVVASGGVADVGLNYIGPMCIPSTAEVKAFADPQSYEMNVDQPWQFSPVFRNTLKKLEGRWTGTLPGLKGNAEFITASQDITKIIKGTLTNNSDYDLHEADIVVFKPHMPFNPGFYYGDTWLYHVKTPDRIWKKGETIDLEKQLAMDLPRDLKEVYVPCSVELLLEVLGRKFAVQSGYNYHTFGPTKLLPQQEFLGNAVAWRDDLLYLLGDLRNQEALDADDRHELVRGIGRMTESTKALEAAGALVIAHAEDVKSPVPLSVNGKQVDGKGSILFAWALPVTGTPTLTYTVPAAPGGGGIELKPGAAGQLLKDQNNPMPEGP
ncbi:MAG TPA: hypothetical protein VGN88_13455, partial [Phycisphaerae bacterium]